MGSPLVGDPRVAALIAAARGDSSQLTTPAPDTMQADPSNIPQSGQSDIKTILQQLFAMPEQAQPRSAMDVQRQQIEELSREKTAMPKPKLGWLDTQGEPASGGFGHKLLRALTAIGAATTPGQAIQGAVYNPAIERYNRSQSNLADRIAALKDESDISKSQLSSAAGTTGAATNMYYKGNMVQQGQEKVDIARQKAQSYAQSVQNKLQMGMRSLDLNAIRTGSQVELNKARIMLDNVLAQTLPERNDITLHGIDAGNETRQAVADLEAQMGLEKEHPFLNMLDQSLGTTLMPSAPQTPGGAQPVRGAKPLPPKSPTPKKAKVLVEGKDF